jgi:hypothetical protein
MPPLRKGIFLEMGKLSLKTSKLKLFVTVLYQGKKGLTFLFQGDIVIPVIFSLLKGGIDVWSLFSSKVLPKTGGTP